MRRVPALMHAVVSPTHHVGIASRHVKYRDPLDRIGARLYPAMFPVSAHSFTYIAEVLDQANVLTEGLPYGYAMMDCTVVGREKQALCCTRNGSSRSYTTPHTTSCKQDVVQPSPRPPRTVPSLRRITTPDMIGRLLMQQ